MATWVVVPACAADACSLHGIGSHRPCVGGHPTASLLHKSGGGAAAKHSPLAAAHQHGHNHHGHHHPLQQLQPSPHTPVPPHTARPATPSERAAAAAAAAAAPAAPSQRLCPPAPKRSHPPVMLVPASELASHNNSSSSSSNRRDSDSDSKASCARALLRAMLHAAHLSTPRSGCMRPLAAQPPSPATPRADAHNSQQQQPQCPPAPARLQPAYRLVPASEVPACCRPLCVACQA